MARNPSLVDKILFGRRIRVGVWHNLTAICLGSKAGQSTRSATAGSNKGCLSLWVLNDITARKNQVVPNSSP